MAEDLDNLFAEFLDDYYAECDEHLVALRSDLLALEDARKAGESLSGPALEDAYRRLHTLKGLSAMVGVVTAERVAHAMEDVIRALRDHRLDLVPEIADGLFDGVAMLEQILTARREGTPTPEIDALLERLAALFPSEQGGWGMDLQFEGGAVSPKLMTDETSEEETPLSGMGARSGGEPVREAAAVKPMTGQVTQDEVEEALWRVIFTPSATLAERGYNVDWVRNQLQRIGTLTQATPLVADDGKIQFEFLVHAAATPEAFAPLAEAGVTWTVVEESKSPMETPPSSPQASQDEKGDTQPSFSSSLLRPSGVVRVDLDRLDELMQIIGELVITRSRLTEHLESIMTQLPRAEQRELREINDTLGRHLRDLREGVMRVRMVPVGEIFERMRFVVRDLARELDKPVDLVLEGKETEVDKLLVERMMDPLLHLVRNALSHGIEDAETRKARGKPVRGRIVLRAATEGDRVRIEVEDDGGGIDLQAVTARAHKMGLLDPDESAAPSTVLDILCAPGFSTRAESDLASGRGVGLSVVKEAVEDLGGHLDLTWEEGHGTRFVIRLPLTLAILDALIVSVGGQMFAVPLSTVQEVMAVTATSLTTFRGDAIMLYRGHALSVIFLGKIFGLGQPVDESLFLLVTDQGGQTCGLVVDRVLGQREIVVRALEDPLVTVSGIAGATELGDGHPVLILDVGMLVKGTIHGQSNTILHSV